MKKLMTIFLLIAFSLGGQAWAAPTVDKTPATAQKQAKKGKKKKLTRQQGYKMQKKAEKEAKQHQMEMRKREFQQMQEAQRRGMIQMQQHSQGKPQ